MFPTAKTVVGYIEASMKIPNDFSLIQLKDSTKLSRNVTGLVITDHICRDFANAKKHEYLPLACCTQRY